MASNDVGSLEGRVALVTGSSRGLGLAMAMELGRRGAKVAMNYANNREWAERSFAELQKVAPQSMLVHADVTDAAHVGRCVTEIREKLGPIDVLVLNATCPQPQLPIEEYSLEFFQTMYDFFVKSPYLVARRCLPHMKRQRWGRIINITSEVFHRSVAPFSAYVAAKGGQIGWSRSMARELAPFGITVNMVAPGWIPVERHEKDPQAEKDAYKALIPVGRWGVPKDVADAVLYLASEESSFVTGQTICVNGGMTPW